MANNNLGVVDIVASEVKTILVSGIIVTLACVTIVNLNLASVIFGLGFDDEFTTSVVISVGLCNFFRRLIVGDIHLQDFEAFLIRSAVNLLIGYTYWMLVYDPRRRGKDINNSGGLMEAMIRNYAYYTYLYISNFGLAINLYLAVSGVLTLILEYFLG